MTLRTGTLDPVLFRAIRPGLVVVVYPAERSTLLQGAPRRGRGSDTVYDVVACKRRLRATVARSCTYAGAEQTLASITPPMLSDLKFR